MEFLSRHGVGEWGVVDREDAEANNEVLNDGSRVLSAYLLRGTTKTWCITEAAGDDDNREATTILLPDEY